MYIHYIKIIIVSYHIVLQNIYENMYKEKFNMSNVIYILIVSVKCFILQRLIL